MILLLRRLKKAKKVYSEINETTKEIEKELLKVKEMLAICQN